MKAPRAGQFRQSHYTSWGYRCFLCLCFEDDAWQVRNQASRFFTHMPLRFVWRPRQDRDGLKTYIDHIIAGRTSEAQRYETDGFVTDVEALPQIRGPEETTNLTFGRFLEVMSLCDKADVPLWGRVRFITDGNRLVPVDFVTALAEFTDPDSTFYDRRGRWRRVNKASDLPEGITPEDVTSGMYRAEHPAMAAAAAAPAAPGGGSAVAPAEVRLVRKEGPGWIELVTAVEAHPRSYFARRIIAGGAMIYEATSWTINGPWTVTKRDSAVMLALGLH